MQIGDSESVLVCVGSADGIDSVCLGAWGVNVGTGYAGIVGKNAAGNSEL